MLLKLFRCLCRSCHVLELQVLFECRSNRKHLQNQHQCAAFDLKEGFDSIWIDLFTEALVALKAIDTKSTQPSLSIQVLMQVPSYLSGFLLFNANDNKIEQMLFEWLVFAANLGGFNALVWESCFETCLASSLDIPTHEASFPSNIFMLL